MDPIVKSIPLSQIQPSKHQARKVFDEVGIKGLAESIRLRRAPRVYPWGSISAARSVL